MNFTATPAEPLLQQGFAAQQRGDLAAAEAAYRALLERAPEHAAALQLLGGLLKKRGDAAGAEALLRRSLAADTRQPHVWNNLGNLLLAAGRNADAIAAFDEALAQLPEYVDAHYNRARALHATQRLPEAATSLNAALARTPQPTVAMLQLHAQIETDSGHLASALRTVELALTAAPDKPALLHNKAVILQRTHRAAEALVLHERVLALGLDAADAHYNRGNTLQSLGRHDQALQAYRTALERQPGHALALFDLARLRYRLGEADWDTELRATLARALEQVRDGSNPAAPAAVTMLAGVLGHLLWRAERVAEAERAYRTAVAHDENAPGLVDGLARCLVRLGRTEEGLTLHRRAVALAPQDVELRANRAASLLVAGRFEAARDEAEAACALAPAHQHAQALRGLAWRLLGDSREPWLNDMQRFVRVVDLPPPPGWASIEAFCAALAEELTALHADRHAPVDQTLRGGTQTVGDIFEQRHPLVDALKARIAEAIDDYVAALPEDASHPFLQRRSSGWRFTDSWSSRLSRQGFHTDHVHPHGWVSSACYVQVPPGVADATRRAGWIRFGQPDLPLPGVPEGALVRRMEVPRVGRLVLFPSMLWHGTTPFDDDAVRMTIAFDVVPA